MSKRRPEQPNMPKCLCGHAARCHGYPDLGYCRAWNRAAWKTKGVGERPCTCEQYRPSR